MSLVNRKRNPDRFACTAIPPYYFFYSVQLRSNSSTMNYLGNIPTLSGEPGRGSTGTRISHEKRVSNEPVSPFELLGPCSWLSRKNFRTLLTEYITPPRISMDVHDDITYGVRSTYLENATEQHTECDVGPISMDTIRYAHK